MFHLLLEAQLLLPNGNPPKREDLDSTSLHSSRPKFHFSAIWMAHQQLTLTWGTREFILLCVCVCLRTKAGEGRGGRGDNCFPNVPELKFRAVFCNLHSVATQIPYSVPCIWFLFSFLFLLLDPGLTDFWLTVTALPIRLPWHRCFPRHLSCTWSPEGPFWNTALMSPPLWSETSAPPPQAGSNCPMSRHLGMSSGAS